MIRAPRRLQSSTGERQRGRALQQPQRPRRGQGTPRPELHNCCAGALSSGFERSLLRQGGRLTLKYTDSEAALTKIVLARCTVAQRARRSYSIVAYSSDFNAIGANIVTVRIHP